MSIRRTPLAAAAMAAAFAAVAGTAIAAAPDTSRGPSSHTDPYVIPVANGVAVTSIFSVDNPTNPKDRAGNGYRMVGIPDGLGARRSAGGGFELFMNQELRDSQGSQRRHGQAGAFVSNYQIGRSLDVKSGRDLINPTVKYWDYPSQTYVSAATPSGPNPRQPGDVVETQVSAFSRFCSGTLSAPGQFSGRSGRGFEGQLYFANEEDGDKGRVFGVTTDGEAQQLPRLGLASWENTKPAYNKSNRTLTIGQEDGGAGQEWIYTGAKSSRGNAFQRAGLTNGDLHVMDLVDEKTSTDADFRKNYGKNNPQEFDLATIDSDQSGASQNRSAAARGLTLNRPEDGAWDPSNPSDYYLVTTEGGDKTPDANDPANTTRDGGGLWRMRFEDIEHPELGGTLTLLLDGSEEPKLNKPDNMDIDRNGNLLLQEDPGGNAHVARIVAYRIADGARGVVAQFDPAVFSATPTNPKPESTIDEESSGIIDAADILGKNTFVFDAQVHQTTGDPETVEYGQLLAMKVKSFDAVYGTKGPRGGGRDDGDHEDRGDRR